MKGGWLRAANLIAGVVFVFAVAVQYNDPDPWPWMSIYGAAAAATFWSAVRPARFRWWVAALIALVALMWAGTLLPQVWGKVKLAELFASFEMKSPRVEVARETGGLLIVALGMGLAVLGAKQNKV